jgi:hypothetical protein
MTLNEKWTDINPKLDDKIIQAIKEGFKFETMMPV